jgi:hypothetical protein
LTGQSAKTLIAANDEFTRAILAELIENLVSHRGHLNTRYDVMTGRLPRDLFAALHFACSLYVFALNYKKNRSVTRSTSALNRAWTFRQLRICRATRQICGHPGCCNIRR